MVAHIGRVTGDPRIGRLLLELADDSAAIVVSSHH
jgi:hypothetical protein